MLHSSYHLPNIPDCDRSTSLSYQFTIAFNNESNLTPTIAFNNEITLTPTIVFNNEINLTPTIAFNNEIYLTPTVQN
jgi:hypothetical protein